MITVVEPKSFVDRAQNLLSNTQRMATIDFIAMNPEAGNIMKGTGGVRKIRIPLQGQGKRGGARVVYYYHNEGTPVFLLYLFAKNERDNLSKAEQNDLRETVKVLVSRYLEFNQ